MQVEAAEATIAALEASGGLEEGDEALVELVRGLAAAVDESPANAALWREYRAAVASLREVGRGGTDDDTASWLLTVRTPVRDSSES